MDKHTARKIKNTLSKLVAVRSVTGNAVAARRVLKVAEKRFISLPVRRVWFGKSSAHPALFVTTGKTLSCDLLLVGHLDVVQAPASLFALRTSGDTLTGRGVADMKGTATVLIEALHDSIVEGLPRGLSIGLLLTTDEETGGAKGAGVLAKKIRAKTVYVPDGGDSEYRISNSTRGILQIGITAQGAGGSTSEPESKNPIEVLMRRYFEWKTSEQKSGRLGDFTAQVTDISSPQTGNALASYCKLFVDIRFESASTQSVLRSVKKFFKSDTYLTTSVEDKGRAEPSYTSPTNKELVRYKKTVERVLGKKAIIRGQRGSHDGRFFSSRTVPVIATRVRSGGMHSDHEWASLASLCNLYDVLKTFIKES